MFVNSNNEFLYSNIFTYQYFRGNTEVFAHTFYKRRDKITKTPLRKNSKGYFIKLTSGLFKPESKNEEDKLINILNELNILDKVRNK